METRRYRAVYKRLGGKSVRALVLGSVGAWVLAGCTASTGPSAPVERPAQVVTQTQPSARVEPPVQATTQASSSTEFELPQAMLNALRANDDASLAPYLASREDYVVVSPELGTHRETVEEAEAKAVRLEISSQVQAINAIAKCRAMAQRVGFAWPKAAISGVCIYRTTSVVHVYHDAMIKGMRTLDCYVTEKLGRFDKGTAYETYVAIELSAEDKRITLILDVRRTPNGPRIVSFAGCAALSWEEARGIAEHRYGYSPDEDEKIVRRMVRGAISEESAWHNGRELSEGSMIWLLLPRELSPGEKDTVRTLSSSSVGELDSLPLIEIVGDVDYVETGPDTCTFVCPVTWPGVGIIGESTIALARESVPQPGVPRAFVAIVNNAPRHFYPVGTSGRLYRAPTETVVEWKDMYGQPTWRIRFEDGFAKECTPVKKSADSQATKR